MRDLLGVAAKDLRRYLRDPIALVFWLGIPLLIGGLMVLATGGSGGPAPQVQLLVADEDDSFLSRLLVGALSHERAGELIRAEKCDADEGRRRMDRGEATALVVIPPGFSAALLEEKPTTLALIVNPSQRILPGIVEELLGMLSEATFYVHRLAGDEIRRIAHGPPKGATAFSDPEIAGLSASLNQTAKESQKYLFPPAIRLETEVVKASPDGAEKPRLPFAFAFLPGVLMLGLLFAAQGLSGDLWEERERGVLRRAATTPGGVARLLLGKLLAIVVVLGGIALVLLPAGMGWMGIAWSRLPAALSWSTAAGLLLTALMLLVQVYASSRRAASFLTFAILLPLMMIGGSMFPLEALPGWLAAIGRWTPNGWAVVQLRAILLGENGPLPLAAAFGVVGVAAAGLLTPAIRRIQRVFARS